MQPSDSPAASSAALVPLAVGLPRGERFSEPAGRAFAYARRVGGSGCGSSAAPLHPWTVRGLPGYWAALLHTRHGQVPRLGRHPLARSRWRLLLPSGCTTPWASRDHEFRGCIPMAHVLACLRINRRVTVAAARLTTDLLGSALVGRDSHPLGNKPNFMKSPHDFLLSDQHCLVAAVQLNPAHPVALPPGPPG